MDVVTNNLVGHAKNDLDAIDTILARAAAGGSRAKPTMAQLNDIWARLGNARVMLSAALGQDTGEPAFDEAVRRARGLTDTATVGTA